MIVTTLFIVFTVLSMIWSVILVLQGATTGGGVVFISSFIDDILFFGIAIYTRFRKS